MTMQELKKYLSMVVDMEKSIYMQERLIKRLTEESSHLCNKYEVHKPNQIKIEENTGCGGAIFAIIVGIVIAIVGAELLVGIVSGLAVWLGVILVVIGIFNIFKVPRKKVKITKPKRVIKKLCVDIMNRLVNRIYA